MARVVLTSFEATPHFCTVYRFDHRNNHNSVLGYDWHLDQYVWVRFESKCTFFVLDD